MTFGGGTEEEIAQLKRSKMDLEKRCKEQDEEMDEMAGQIQVSFRGLFHLNFNNFDRIFLQIPVTRTSKIEIRDES